MLRQINHIIMAKTDEYLTIRYELLPKHRQQYEKLNRAVGSARRCYNEVLAFVQDEYLEYLDEVESRLIYGEASTRAEAKALCTPLLSTSYASLSAMLPGLKKQYPFLEEDCYSQVLQQKLKDLSFAFKSCWKNYEKTGQFKYPKFQRKFHNDSIRYPQGFERNSKGEPVNCSHRNPQGFIIEQHNNRIVLPGLGSIHYRKHRPLGGIPKTVTVKKEPGKWYIYVQVKVEAQEPRPVDLNKGAAGDVGIVHFISMNEGTFVDFPHFEKVRKIENKIGELQRQAAAKKKGSRRYRRLQFRIAKDWRKITNIRKDFLHKLSRHIESQGYDYFVVEDLNMKNMTASAKGTIASPGRNVRAKSGLNRSILRMGWYTFVCMLEYKMRLSGRFVIKVNPRNTSITCPKCGNVDKQNRRSQAEFKCTKCLLTLNADTLASINQLRAGRAQMLALCSKGEVTLLSWGEDENLPRPAP